MPENTFPHKDTGPSGQIAPHEFYNILGNAPIGIFTSTPEGRFLYANPALAWMYGYETPEEMTLAVQNIGTQLYADPADRQKFKSLLETYGEVVNYEYRLRRRDGSVYWVSTNARAVRDQNGNITLYQGFTTDITRRKWAQDALLLKHSFLQGIIDSSPIPFCSLDRDYKYTSFNQAHVLEMKRLYDAEIQLGHPLCKYQSIEENRGKTRKNIDRALCGERIVEETYSGRRELSGKYVEATYNPIRDEQGRVTGVCIFSKDITERKEIEKKLRESEEKYRSLVEQSVDIMYLHDLEGNFLDVNQAAISHTGFSREEFMRMNLFDLNPNRSFQKDIKRWWEELQIGQSVILEATQLCKDGDAFPVEVRTGKIRFGDKNYILSLIRDITRPKLAEKALNDQLQFERMVSDISTRFMQLPSQRLKEGIVHALKSTGELFDFDFSYLFLFSEDEQTVRIAYEWNAPGIEPQANKMQDFDVNAFPWLITQIRTKDYVHILDVDNLPPEATAEKIGLQSQAIQSILCVPVIKNSSLFGFLGFGAVEDKREWIKNYAVLVKVVAELISNALARGMAEERIRHLSFHDQLTGLYNRLYLEEEMKRLDTERQLPISIIMADLNGLKLVNDSYGHAVGDEMLRTAARILTNSCRKDDIIARWGGDEFMIFLPKAVEKRITAICSRIKEMCAGACVEDIPVSMALGFAIKDHAGKALIETFKEADDMMYKNKLAESRSTRSAVLNALLKTLAEKSFETGAHALRMREMALKIGKKLKLSYSELDRLSLLATLHDIGKIKMPEEILTKKSALTKEEWREIKKHPETGYRIACATKEFAHVADEILCHHERWDGSGYPRGLKGKEIPLLARITSIADASEVMIKGRPYKKPLTSAEMASELKNCTGKQFDPELVDIFLSVLQENA